MPAKKEEDIDLSTVNVRRSRPPSKPEEPEEKKGAVSAGPIDRVVELVFNPSRDKIREVTSVDRMQARLLPQLDIIDMMWAHVLEIAYYRQDAEKYNETFKKKVPAPPNLIDEFTFRTAQWQKSVNALNLNKGVDIALAETETRMESEEAIRGHGFDEE